MRFSNPCKFTEADCAFVARRLSFSEFLKDLSITVERRNYCYDLVVTAAVGSGESLRRRHINFSFDDLRQNLSVQLAEAGGDREAFLRQLVALATNAFVLWQSPRYAEHKSEPSTPLDTQVGGSHYKDMVIQPVEFVHRNKLGYLEGNVIKYVCRHKAKNGVQDLLKARHYLELLLELEYGFASSPPDAAEPGAAQEVPGQPPGDSAFDLRFDVEKILGTHPPLFVADPLVAPPEPKK